MGFLDKVKAGAEQAATKAREGVQEMQTKRELNQAYAELGEKAFELAEAGSLQHSELDAGIERIRTVKRELEEIGEPETAGTSAGTSDSTST